MGRHRKNSESLFDAAVSSSWPVSATIAAVILGLGFVVFPFLARGNTVMSAMAQGVKPAVLMVAGLLGVVSLIKFIASKVSKTNVTARGAPSRNVFDFKRPPAHETPGAHIRRDPMLGADPVPVSAKPLEWSLELIQTIEWKRFEDVCQKFHESKGIRIACTPLGPDGGIDIAYIRAISFKRPPSCSARPGATATLASDRFGSCSGSWWIRKSPRRSS